jgi:hypothetical protein
MQYESAFYGSEIARSGGEGSKASGTTRQTSDSLKKNWGGTKALMRDTFARKSAARAGKSAT